ncbi:hypothetical protein K490DRAFT_61884 [Saccharata proteae CBS 121410]|uniref:Zn(2)-C6 fungal-type domain-containing protein n=1 Tax=Saccharata proteae CBS 121410 TaxID=1314787 RepID=A0A9P4M258_9PEZI|nr:hypothetical protein K490DRAFT_61884 [Saccharata proteae CBS 121410]
MVGVPKSKGCRTCIDRKIKCDETWPTCGNCQKSQKYCPGKSDRYRKFVDEGPRHRNRDNSLEDESTSPSSSSTASFDSAAHVEAALEPITGNIEHVSTTKTKDGGGVFVKLRFEPTDPPKKRPRKRSSVPKCPPVARNDSMVSPSAPNVLNPGCPSSWTVTSLDTLRNKLIFAIEVTKPGYQVINWGAFLKQLPQRLGTPVLDDAAALLADTCHALLNPDPTPHKVNPKVYGKALNSLIKATGDISEKNAMATLCASALLAITEATAVGGCGTNRNFITHIGGAADILKQVGPAAFSESSSFERSILRSCTVGINMNAIFFDKDDLLADPEWSQFAFDTNNLPQPWISKTKVSEAMAHLPGLCRDIRAYDAGTENTSSTGTLTLASLTDRTHHIRNLLDETRPYLSATVLNTAIVQRTPSSDPLFPEHLSYASLPYAWVFWFYWGMRIITNTIDAALLHRRSSFGFQPFPADLQHLADLDTENREMSKLLCSSIDYARACRPIGAIYIDIGLVMAHKVFSTDPSLSAAAKTAHRDSVLDKLNSLHDDSVGRKMKDLGSTTVGWTHERVERLAAWMTGGRIDGVDYWKINASMLGTDEGEARKGNLLKLPPNGLEIEWPGGT